MAALEALLPEELERHCQLQWSRLDTYQKLREKVVLYAEARGYVAPKLGQVSTAREDRDDPMDVGGFGQWKCSGDSRTIAPLPCSGDSRTIAPLPCCGCAFMYRCPDRMTCTCSATILRVICTCCSHCVSRVACRLRARVVVVEPPTAS